MKNTATIGIAALLVGGAGGFLAGKAGSPDKPDQSQAKAEQLAGKTQRSAPNAAGETSRAPRDVKQALSEPGQLSRMQKLMDLYNGMSADQLKEQAEKLDQLEGAERMMASFLLFGRWGEVDPQGALAYVNSTPFGGFARPTILQSWAASDPVNAAKYFSEHSNELRGFGGGPGGGGFGGGDNAAGVIATEWAKLDPKAALEWAKGLEGRDKGSALNSVIGQMAAKNPQDAAAVAASLDAEDQPRAYSEIAQKWGATDFASAEAWINTLPAESRDRALASALESYANTDPAGAASKWAAMPAGDQRDNALRSIADAWARTDPQAAAKFVAGQDSENIGDAIRGVMNNWTAKDQTGALAFIQSQPQGELRDEATSTYIFRSQSDPQTSIQLAETIDNERSRSRAISMSVFRWMQQDREAASAYVQSSSALNEETKQSLLEGRPPWGGGPGGRGGNGGGRGGRGGN